MKQMGTRVDYYIGTGPNAEWLGSCSYDGDEESHRTMLRAKTEQQFRRALEKRLSEPDFGPTRPPEGWPWPWEDSRTTDMAYAWCEDVGATKFSKYGMPWVTSAEAKKLRAGRDGSERFYGRAQMLDSEVRDMSALTASSDVIIAKSGLMFLRVR